MFHPTKTLRVALILQWVFIAACITADSALSHTLPAVAEAEAGGGEGLVQTLLREALDQLGWLCLVAIVVSSIGLWLRQRWARLPYLLASLLLPVLAFDHTPSLSPPLSDFFDEYSVLIQGFIVALIYFGPVRFRDADPANPADPA